MLTSFDAEDFKPWAQKHLIRLDVPPKLLPSRGLHVHSTQAVGVRAGNCLASHGHSPRAASLGARAGNCWAQGHAKARRDAVLLTPPGGLSPKNLGTLTHILLQELSIRAVLHTLVRLGND